MSDDLRGLAEAAYPKPRGLCDDWFESRCPDLAHLRQQEQDFIAAANPTAVLALLDRLEAAEAAMERVRALADEWDRRALPISAEFENAITDLHDALEGAS